MHLSGNAQYCYEDKSHNLTYRFTAMQINVSACFIDHIGKLTLKIRWRFKAPTMVKIALKKRKELHYLFSKLIFNFTVFRECCVSVKIDQ
jgi:hypothetical protein